MATVLSEVETLRIEVVKPGYLNVYYPPMCTPKSLDEFYPRFIEILKAQPDKSCVIGDFSETQRAPFSAAIRGVHWMPQTKPYMRRVAGFGFHPLFENIIRSILIMSGRQDIRLFKTRAEAEAWAFEGL